VAARDTKGWFKNPSPHFKQTFKKGGKFRRRTEVFGGPNNVRNDPDKIKKVQGLGKLSSSPLENRRCGCPRGERHRQLCVQSGGGRLATITAMKQVR